MDCLRSWVLTWEDGWSLKGGSHNQFLTGFQMETRYHEVTERIIINCIHSSLICHPSQQPRSSFICVIVGLCRACSAWLKIWWTKFIILSITLVCIYQCNVPSSNIMS